MTPGERIDSIKESATLLSQQNWGDIDLILSQYGISTTPDLDGDAYHYVLAMLKDASNDALHSLHQYLTGESEDISSEAQPWAQGQLRLFMSHLATHQEFVGEVRDYLNLYGSARLWRTCQSNRLRSGKTSLRLRPDPAMRWLSSCTRDSIRATGATRKSALR
jgi:hypothetical protein